MKIKTVLLSQVPLPYSKIGSWPKFFDYYFNENSFTEITDIVSPDVSESLLYPNVKYHIVKNNFFLKFISKITKKRHQYFINKAVDILRESLNGGIFLVIDNYGLLFELDVYLKKLNLRQKAKIIYFSHGYTYNFDPFKSEKFYDSIDRMVFLSEKSYQFELNRTHSITSKVSILPNGVDLKKFLQVDSKRKNELKHALGVKDKTVFLWCANERPKKGLHILLDAWCNSSLFKNDVFELLIIGTHKIGTQGNIRFLGRIQNNDLSKYYQVTDYYLFTTLCHEGFPLSLTEAIACGSKCIVSQIDPLPDIFQKFGNITFVENPNIVASWIEKLELAASGNLEFDELNHALIHHELSLEKWCSRLNEIILSEVQSIPSTIF